MSLMKTISTPGKKGNFSSKMLAAFAFFLFIGGSAIAQVTYTDTVCASSQDVVYGITGASATSTYTWSISNPAAGSIDNSITSNDSEIQIDWGILTGTFTLYAYETTADGCLGDSITLDVVINPLPTVAIASDSVCENFSATLTFDLTGQAPWTIDYTDGTTSFTTVANSTPHTVSLPPYVTSQTITVTGVTDSNTCDADASGLPSTNVTSFAKPVTGAIYHY